MRLSLLIAVLLGAPLGGTALAATDSPETAAIADAPAAGGPAAPGPAATDPTRRPRPIPRRDSRASSRRRSCTRISSGSSVLPGTGYRIIAPYKDGVPCGQQANRVCTGWLPFFVEVQPSFGFARHWDVIVDLRFGVAADFNKSHEFAVAPGIRYWVDPEPSDEVFRHVSRRLRSRAATRSGRQRLRLRRAQRERLHAGDDAQSGVLPAVRRDAGARPLAALRGGRWHRRPGPFPLAEACDVRRATCNVQRATWVERLNGAVPR